MAGLSDLARHTLADAHGSFLRSLGRNRLNRVARQVGGVLRAGRRGETVSPLSWDPPHLGSQRTLVPDMILEVEGTSFIVDAKYKRHWEEFQSGPYHEQDVGLRDSHRADLHQVLAYANLAQTNNVVCCLVYPCALDTWKSLALRNRLFLRAELPNQRRRVHVWLTAMPMGATADDIAVPFNTQIRTWCRASYRQNVIIRARIFSFEEASFTNTNPRPSTSPHSDLHAGTRSSHQTAGAKDLAPLGPVRPAKSQTQTQPL